MAKQVIIMGAGGHGREVADILSQMNAPGRSIAFLDDSVKEASVDGYPVQGGMSWIQGKNKEEYLLINGLGTPSTARRILEPLAAAGHEFVSAVSQDATVSPSALIGTGVAIFPKAVVNVGARIGDHVILNVGVSVSHDCRIGAYCNINPGARIAGNVEIGDECYIGMGAQIIQGVKIGEHTIVGAGAAVIRDLPDNVTAVGVPARVIKREESGA